MTTKPTTTNAASEAWKTLREEMSLGDYVEMVLKDKTLNRPAADYVYGALLWHGSLSAPDNSGGNAHAAFSGLDSLATAVDSTIEYLKLAASGDPVGHRALVLTGPSASGGDLLLSRIITAVQAYSRTDQGKVYAIADCPIAEDPLNLIEPDFRNRMVALGSLQRAGGRLCPDCHNTYGTKLADTSLAEIRVRRIVLGLDDGSGAALVSGHLGDNNGDLHVAVDRSNRGVLAYENLCEAPLQAVQAVLDLAASHSYLGRNGRTRWDGVVIATADQTAFAELCTVPRFAAARLQAHPVPIPYNMNLQLEVQAYSTHRSGHDLLSRVYFSPLTLPTVAKLALATRTPPATSPVGMGGLALSRVLSAIEDCAAAPDVECVSPLLVLSELADYVEVEPQQVEKTASAYVQEAVEMLRRAATDGFEKRAQDLLSSYVERVGWIFDPPDPASPPTTGESERRDMENALRLKDSERPDFREKIHLYFEQHPEAGYTDEPNMKEAIERRLLHPLRRILKDLKEVAVGSAERDDWARRRGAVHDRLVNDYDFCPNCAIDLVAMLLATDQPVRAGKKGLLDWHWPVRIDPAETRDEFQKFRSASPAANGKEGSGC